jgi:putative transposase
MKQRWGIEMLIPPAFPGPYLYVHLLVNEPERGTLAQALQSLKQGVARQLALRAEESFWQARYYDFNVWGERKLRRSAGVTLSVAKWRACSRNPERSRGIEKLRYIHRNPVTRGLAARPEDWQWSSFRHYLTGAAGAVEIESQWTARRRERLGIFPMLKVRAPAENPRPSKA